MLGISTRYYNSIANFPQELLERAVLPVGNLEVNEAGLRHFTQIQVFLSWFRAFRFAGGIKIWGVADQSYLLAQLFFVKNQLELLHEKMQVQLLQTPNFSSVNISEIINQIRIFCQDSIDAVNRKNRKILAYKIENIISSLTVLALALNRLR